MVPRGLEPRTLRLLAARSNQLSYETLKTYFAEVAGKDIEIKQAAAVRRNKEK